ncbi:MAG: hypothetical protein LBM76_03160 [Mycoplasmataceae bacterium]|nr:hypothetical protein [Mycoplasmataceae bacterium]
MKMGKVVKRTLTISCLSIFLFDIIVFSSSCVDTSEIVNSLLPNAWVLIANILASVIIFALVVWMVWKPTTNMLAKRRQFINEELYSAEQANRESFIKLSEAEQTRINAYSDAKMIIENARNEAYMDKENIQSETKILVKKMLEDAKNNGIKLQNQIRQTMNDQILDIAMTATEALLQKKVNKKENEKFVKQAIDNIKVLGGEDDR